jgi:UDP-3-O-[3-hydroxymyristoyl] glucosamine N-acyltransferase
MAESRFSRSQQRGFALTAPPADGYRLDDIAKRFKLTLKGHGEHRIDGLATLAQAGPSDLSFLANPAYLAQLPECQAGAVILSADKAERFDGNCLISPNPYADWSRLAAFLHPTPNPSTGIHPTAVVDPDCQVAASAWIGPQTVIGPGCRIREDAVIGPGCVIENDVEIGAGARLVAQVFVGSRCHLGQRVLVHPGVVVGADGFGLAFDQGNWLKVPQLGRVIIGDDCEIGANTTIDRGAIDDTVLEEDVRLDNQVQIAHNVRIGAHTAIAGCTGIAGSTTIGRYCMIAGASGIAGHLTICDKVIITAMSTVLDSIDQPGEYGSGIPARRHSQWKRILVRLGQLDDWARRLKRTEKHQQTSEK